MRWWLSAWHTGRPARTAAGRPAALDRGSSPIEELLVLPALMLLILAALQFAYYGLAAHAAALALSEGPAEARASGGGLAAGERLVRQDLRAIAPHLVVTPRLSVQRHNGAPTVLVLTGVIPSIFPGVHLEVSVASAGFAERFQPG